MGDVDGGRVGERREGLRVGGEDEGSLESREDGRARWLVLGAVGRLRFSFGG